MVILENDFLRVVINPVGAELNSLFNKTTGQEYLWSGDAKFWGKRSPVLFPIIGTLKNNRYFIEEKSYVLSRHGFAREKTFAVKEQTPSSVIFGLLNDAETQLVFPFEFNFSLLYTIYKNSLSVTYLVRNTGNDRMYFSVGGHPAFKLPLAAGLTYADYYLQFNTPETVGRWPVSAQGLIELTPVPLLQNTSRLPLTKSLFYNDAIVFKDLKSDEVEVKSARHPAGFRFSFKGFPFLGIWAAKDADFICIEPWCGIADSVNSRQVLTEKEGIISLPRGEDFKRVWTVTLF